MPKSEKIFLARLRTFYHMKFFKNCKNHFDNPQLMWKNPDGKTTILLVAGDVVVVGNGEITPEREKEFNRQVQNTREILLHLQRLLAEANNY